jgi:hypothetical protein
MDEFNAVAVDHGEEGRLRQELLTPPLMDAQGTLHAGAIRQTCEQRVVIALQPAVKGTEVTALQGERQLNGDQFTRIQARLGMLRHCSHLVIYPTEQFDDKVLGGHGSYLQQFGDYWFYEFRDLFSTSTNGYYLIIQLNDGDAAANNFG